MLAAIRASTGACQDAINRFLSRLHGATHSGTPFLPIGITAASGRAAGRSATVD